jgi:response regulator NasT
MKEKLEEIKLVNNAKLLLINNKHISENEAHKYIEQRAMFIRKTKRYVAEEIINKYKKGDKK